MQKLGATWIEIDLDAIAHNIRSIKEIVGEKVKIMGVIKANAYGHDVLEVASALYENGVSHFAVARVGEGVELRKAGIDTPILILGLTLKEQMESLLEYNLTPTVCNIEEVDFLSKLATKHNKVVKVHVKVDTGLGRIGILPEDALTFIQKTQHMDNIDIEGIFTHFATSNEKDKSYTEEQFRKFSDLLTILKENKINIKLKHSANSSATIVLPYTRLDMVRPGLIIYGLYRSPEEKNMIKLKPALKFKTKIVYVKKVPAGKYIGYGRTYTTTSETIMATLPVGFVDGLPRILSNNGEVTVKGSKAPIIGRIAMDQAIIDVSSIPEVKVGDEVTLFGNHDIEELAQKINTVPEEICCNTDCRRVPKLFFKGGKPYKIKSILGEKLL